MTMTNIDNIDNSKNAQTQGKQSPNKTYQQEAAEFIEKTSLEDMIEIADEAVRRKRLERAQEGPKWVFPEDGIQP